MSITNELKALADLFREGLLTKDEFEQQKKRILAGNEIPSGSPPVGMTPPSSESVGSYRLKGVIGQGGMGIVYRARHMSDTIAKRQGGDVAVKVLHAQYAENSTYRTRFEREANLGLELDHPGIVKVYDLLVDGGHLAIAMELLEGQPLSAVIGQERGPIPWREAIDMFQHLCEAVQYAHEQEVIHRDLKPENVVLSNNGTLKVLDFGIAKELGSGTTKTGTGMGTVDYMAPEQYTDASKVDKRADIYALGMTLYEMLAGRLPWPAGLTEYKVLVFKDTDALPKPTEFYPDIPPELVHVVMKATALDISLRHSSVTELLDELQAVLNGDDIVLATPPISAAEPIENARPSADATQESAKPVEKVSAKPVEKVSANAVKIDVSENVAKAPSSPNTLEMNASPLERYALWLFIPIIACFGTLLSRPYVKEFQLLDAYSDYFHEWSYSWWGLGGLIPIAAGLLMIGLVRLIPFQWFPLFGLGGLMFGLNFGVIGDTSLRYTWMTMSQMFLFVGLIGIATTGFRDRTRNTCILLTLLVIGQHFGSVLSTLSFLIVHVMGVGQSWAGAMTQQAPVALASMSNAFWNIPAAAGAQPWLSPQWMIIGLSALISIVVAMAYPLITEPPDSNTPERSNSNLLGTLGVGLLVCLTLSASHIGELLVDYHRLWDWVDFSFWGNPFFGIAHVGGPVLSETAVLVVMVPLLLLLFLMDRYRRPISPWWLAIAGVLCCGVWHVLYAMGVVHALIHNPSIAVVFFALLYIGQALVFIGGFAGLTRGLHWRIAFPLIVGVQSGAILIGTHFMWWFVGIR